MKALALLLPLTALVMFADSLLLDGKRQKTGQGVLAPVNPVVGDQSFAEKFGTLPNAQTSESLRIATHLAFAEEKLRGRDMSHLSKTLQENRQKNLSLLRRYRLAGQFPRNYDKPGRRPCFIDRDGNICAVGYLVAQTAGMAMAEAINEKHQYAAIHDMDDPRLAGWVAESGLTLEECAMIQPFYGPYLQDNGTKTEPAYVAATSVLGAANLGLGTINALQLRKGKEGGKWLPVAGLVSGVASVSIGLARFNDVTVVNQQLSEGIRWGGSIEYTTYNRRELSVANIATGTFSAALGAVRLLRKPNGKKTQPTLTEEILGTVGCGTHLLPDGRQAPVFTFHKTF